MTVNETARTGAVTATVTVTWGGFAAAAPEFATRVRGLLTTQKHMTLATLRLDGSPRISGTEIQFDDDAGELVLGMMAGSLKARDLLRDPRLALHGPTFDAPDGDDQAWAGDAKISGTAVDVTTPLPDGSHRFAIRIGEVVTVKVGTPNDHLVIESWTPAGGLLSRRRY